jgi:hypothetical protein
MNGQTVTCAEIYRVDGTEKGDELNFGIERRLST